MKNTLVYKNQTANIQFSAEDGVFVGRLIGIEDVVGFHADTVIDLQNAFEDAVDDYLESCRQLGRPPLKLASGNLMLRVSPEIHTAVLIAAQAAGKSLNQWAAEALNQASQHR